MMIDPEERATVQPSSNRTPQGVTRRGVAASLAGGALLGASGEAAPAAPVTDLFPPALIDVRTHGAVGDGRADDTKALQAAIDEARGSGRRVYLPAGRFRVTRTLVWRTSRQGADIYSSGLRMSGDGPTRSVIVAACAGPALLIDAAEQTTGAVDHHFDLGLHLSDFGVSGAHAKSVGLQLRGQWYGSIERCRITNHGRHGLVIAAKTLNADWYVTAGLRVIGCDISDNRGWGVTAEAALAMTLPRFERCRITENREGGLDFNGFGLELVACAVAANGVWLDGVAKGGGVWLRNHGDGVPNDFFRIEGCEFDDNFEYHLRVDYCSTGVIQRNRFVCNVVDRSGSRHLTPTIALRLGETRAPVRTLDIHQNIWMAVDELAAHGLAQEFIRIAPALWSRSAKRIRLSGSVHRWRVSTRLGHEALMHIDDECGGDSFVVAAGGALALRPMRASGSGFLRVRDKAIRFVFDAATGLCAPIDAAPKGLRVGVGDDASSQQSGVSLTADSAGALWLRNAEAQPLNDWFMQLSP